MIRFNLAIDCNNEAFDDMASELSRILLNLAARITGGDMLDRPTPIHDINGNRVGTVEIKEL